MIDIVCLKWGTKFSPDYVNNLYSKGTPNRTYISEYGNKLGLGGLEPTSDTADE